MNPTITRVARHFGIPEAVLMGPSRKAHIANARQIAMYLLCRRNGLTLLGASEELDRNVHTVWHGVRRIEALLRYGDAKTAHDVAALEEA